MPAHPPFPARRRPGHRPLLVAGIAAALAAGACGGTERPVETGGPAAQAAPADIDGLPVLPPVQEQVPERYDDAGCTRVGPSEVSCASTADQVDAAARGDDPGDWRRLAGFEGRFYDPAATSGSPVLLEGTATIATAGAWTAMGLARNDTGAPIGLLVVGATLVGADGTVLETIEAPSPVTSIRPGEPVPYRLEATTDAAAVTEVRWSLRADPAVAADVAARDLAVATWWTRDPASGRVVDFPLHTDAPGETSYLLFGGVENVGRTVAGPRVVGAWLDPAGRVVAVADAPATDDAGVARTELAAGAAADVLLVIDDPVAAAAAAATAPMLWGVGR